MTRKRSWGRYENAKGMSKIFVIFLFFYFSPFAWAYVLATGGHPDTICVLEEGGFGILRTIFFGWENVTGAGGVGNQPAPSSTRPYLWLVSGYRIACSLCTRVCFCPASSVTLAGCGRRPRRNATAAHKPTALARSIFLLLSP